MEETDPTLTETVACDPGFSRFILSFQMYQKCHNTNGASSYSRRHTGVFYPLVSLVLGLAIVPLVVKGVCPAAV